MENSAGSVTCWFTSDANWQKFFASFFQKRRPSFLKKRSKKLLLF